MNRAVGLERAAFAPAGELNYSGSAKAVVCKRGLVKRPLKNILVFENLPKGPSHTFFGADSDSDSVAFGYCSEFTTHSDSLLKI